ncbi:AAA domain-containing protein, partial [Ruminococcaceae bacterium OttesenSCG-928-D13]|nr:AAA domain-containing protein [Ruminococcaceae bacterium OttesenSCG-928-D13]
NTEPPVPDAFAATLAAVSGMDIDLKEILTKMVAIEPKDRYEDLVDVELALSSLVAKYSGSSEQYVFSVASERTEELRKRKLAPYRKTNMELLLNDIPENFTDSYVRVEKEGEVELFVFDGLNYSMSCTFSDSKFNVIRFERLDLVYRERNKKRALPVNGKCIFFDGTKRSYPQNQTFQFRNRIIDHMDHVLSKHNIDTEFDNMYGFWNEFIKIMIADAANQAIKFNYASYETHDKEIVFKLCEDSCLGDDSITTETTFIIEKTTKKKDIALIEIGRFERFEDDGSIIVLKITNSKGCAELAEHGQFSVDYRKEIAQYKRQAFALDEFIQDEAYDKSLKGIFAGIEPASSFSKNQQMLYYDQKLDQAQKSAVSKILDARNLALIQGPPGTGKTNVLIEVIRQIQRHNRRNPLACKKILIVSQSHAAVDKIIEDLDAYGEGDAIIRIGADEKLSDLAREKYSFESQRALWVSEIASKCLQETNSVLSTANICPQDFASYAHAYEKLQIKGISKVDANKAEEIVKSFLMKYRLENDNPLISRLRIQHQWYTQIPESQDIDEYFIKNATIVAGTCSGFIGNHFVREIVFDYVIIDEAAKATLPEMMVSLIKAKKAVLVGDHKQLPPVFDRLAIERSAVRIDYDELQNGGFGKIFDIIDDQCKETLTTQYRMHPAIGTLISKVFYGDEIQNGVGRSDRSLDLGDLSLKPITWVSTSNLDSKTKNEQRVRLANGNFSFHNPIEAEILIEYLMALDDNVGSKGFSIGIITPYRAQLNLIQRRLKSVQLKNIGVEINTVDAFQGSQRDIILYSTVRSSSGNQIGFLREESRLNVSLSRARSNLIIAGDDQFLNNKQISGNRFPDILEYIHANPDECTIIPYTKKGVL